MTGFCPSRLGSNPVNLVLLASGLFSETEREIEWSMLFLHLSSFLPSFKHCDVSRNPENIKMFFKQILVSLDSSSLSIAGMVREVCAVNISCL